MPRKHRVFSQTFPYHIIARGNNRASLFRCDEDFERLLSLVAFLKTHYVFDIFHFCLMTNHVHLLMRFSDREAFKKVPQRLFLNYAKHVARSHRNSGHVFQDRFRSLPVGDNRYFLECGRYIERNPIAARMVDAPESCKWSSYRHYAFGETVPWLTTNPLYSDLGTTDEERRRRYRELVTIERPYEAAVEAGLFGRSAWAKVTP